MKNTIRYCIACILPCGALDVIRIVHSNGHVEEISGTIKAGDIMKAHPKHILKKPSSHSEFDGNDKMVPKIVILPPDAELKRGKIYFLMPVPQTLPEKKPKASSKTATKTSRSSNRDCETDHHHGRNRSRKSSEFNKSDSISTTNFLVSDQYLSEIMSEKISTQKDRRRGRVAVWRPHLESISETANDGETRCLL